MNLSEQKEYLKKMFFVKGTSDFFMQYTICSLNWKLRKRLGNKIFFVVILKQQITDIDKMFSLKSFRNMWKIELRFFCKCIV